MPCYMGTRGGCAKMRWATFVIGLTAALALLGSSLYATIPGAVDAVKCLGTARDLPGRIAAGGVAALQQLTADEIRIAQGGPGVCWSRFWERYQIQFVLSCVGLVCLVVALLTCCCFCCAEAPPKGPQYYQDAGGQFIAYPTDTSPYPDQQHPYGAAQPPAKDGMARY